MDQESNNIIKKEYLDVVKRYVQKLKGEGLPIEGVYIFGSTATGKRNKWSDIDTCIISSSFGDDRLSNRVFLMKRVEGISDLIEPHPLSPEDFKDRYNPLVSEIKKWGVKVA